MEELFLLLLAGFASACINSLAGGGGLLTFAILTGMGISSLQANMITAVGLWPGALSGAVPYASNWKQIVRKEFFLILIMVVGGLLGSALLLNTADKNFVTIIPYLLLFVFLLLSLKQRMIGIIMNNGISFHRSINRNTIALFIYLPIAIYGSYFGAGVGVLLLAILLMERQGELKELNKTKLILVLLNSTAGVLLFLYTSILPLEKIICLASGSAAGGWLGSRWSEKISNRWFDRFILYTSGILCIYYFYKNYSYD